MGQADAVITGTVLTVDEARPTAEAVAIDRGKIVAVGTHAEVAEFIGSNTQAIDISDGCVMPGFVEAQGHPLTEEVALSDRIVDIRPVTMRSADDDVAAVRSEVARTGSDGAYLNGWDSLLQNGLPEPTLRWLDGIAPDTPRVILHNSEHKAYFNAHAARLHGLNRDTPDPKGAKFGRDAGGELDGTTEKTGAVFPLVGDVIVDGLFGEERGSRWMPGGSAVATGMRISLHNDPPVAPEERLTVEQAIRAQPIDAAWQLFADDVIGSLEVGKYADLVVLSADPRTVPPDQIADLEVRATYLAGRRVYPQ